MSDLKGRTIRLSEENWEWLDSQPGTMNEVITNLRSAPAPDSRIDNILELVQSQPSTEDIQEMFDSFIQTVREARAQTVASDPRSVAGVQTGYEGLAKNVYCKHCGNKFAGNKFAQVCPECEELGHKRVPPAECPECQASNAL